MRWLLSSRHQGGLPPLVASVCWCASLYTVRVVGRMPDLMQQLISGLDHLQMMIPARATRLAVTAEHARGAWGPQFEAGRRTARALLLYMSMRWLRESKHREGLPPFVASVFCCVSLHTARVIGSRADPMRQLMSGLDHLQVMIPARATRLAVQATEPSVKAD